MKNWLQQAVNRRPVALIGQPSNRQFAQLAGSYSVGKGRPTEPPSSPCGLTWSRWPMGCRTSGKAWPTPGSSSVLARVGGDVRR